MTKQVLMVEDDKVLRRLFRDVLVHYDCKISEAGSLPEAHQQLDKQSFDFVLCDIHLGEETSLEAADRCLREKIPVIIISSDDAYIKPLKENGIAAFLVKPVHIPDLVEIVQNIDNLESFQTVRYPR